MRAGFVHLYCGQEAVSTGVIRHLKQDDFICSTYRDHVHALSKVLALRFTQASPSTDPLTAAACTHDHLLFRADACLCDPGDLQPAVGRYDPPQPAGLSS